MKKGIVAALILGLVAGGMLAVPAEGAKKKKKKLKPVTAAVFLRDETEGLCSETPRILRFADGPDVKSCGFQTDGLGNEILITAGQEPFYYTWVLADETSFVLDTTQELVAKFFVRTSTQGVGGAGGGFPTLDVTITGTSGGESQVIGEASISYTATPGEAVTPVEIKIEPDAALNKKKFTSIELTPIFRGRSVRHGFFSLDEPASHFTMSILTPGGKLPKGATPPPAD